MTKTLRAQRHIKRPVARTALLALCSLALVIVCQPPAFSGPIDPPPPAVSVNPADQLAGPLADHQETLLGLSTWLQADPKFSQAGYIAPVFDLQNLAVTLLWKGDSPVQQDALAEAARLGITATIEQRPYTMSELRTISARVFNDAATLRTQGFELYSLSGVRADNGDIVVGGRQMDATVSSSLSPAGRTPSLAAVESEVSRVASAPVRVVAQGGPDVPTAVTRDTDTEPYNAGGFMYAPSDKNACTTGFAVRIAGTGYITTARHCRENDFQAYAKSSSKYGGTYTYANGGQARIMTRTGWGRTFDGAATDPNGFAKRVHDYVDVGLNTIVCVSGANSGARCNIKITDMAFNFQDGYGYELNIRGNQQDTRIAIAKGDSGGPVMIPISGGTSEHAVGMIQGAVGGTDRTCPSLQIATSCYYSVLFTSTHTILNNLGASLMTQ